MVTVKMLSGFASVGGHWLLGGTPGSATDPVAWLLVVFFLLTAC